MVWEVTYHPEEQDDLESIGSPPHSEGYRGAACKRFS